jgi:hypothetical protein
VLFRRPVQLPVRGKHWAEVASGLAQAHAEHEYVRDCGCVRHHSFSCAVQPARFVLAERLAPRINRVQRDMINALRISICAKSPKLIVWSPTRADTIAHLSADGLIHVK